MFSGTKLPKSILAFALIVSMSAMTSCVCKRTAKTLAEGEGANEGDVVGSTIPEAEPASDLADVRFEYDSSKIKASEAATLKANAKWLKANPSTDVVVQGHCDERGTNEYNLALGERRAKAVAQYLQKLGVASSQLTTVSYGEEMPLDPGHDESAWAKNRRVHFESKK